MPATRLEHVNVTVRDSDATAKWMCEVFGWRVRWRGDSIHEGYSVHVGEDDSYVALYTPPAMKSEAGPDDSYFQPAGLNHIAVVVDDLDATEQRVEAAGFAVTSHHDYEPGRRFYFTDDDGIEVEVVAYD